MSSKFLSHPKLRVLSFIILISALILGGSAVAINVNNTPQGGYLLCVNNKTRVVTFPGTLRCPNGTTSIQIPGSENVSSGSQKDPKQGTSETASPSNTKSEPRCNLEFLIQNKSQVSDVLAKCSSKQLSDLEKSLSEQTMRIQSDLDKLSRESEELRKSGATVDFGALSKQADEGIAKIGSNTSLLTQIIAEVSKRLSK